MASVYILYSISLDKYYIGSCKDLKLRLEEHSSKKYELSYTAKAEDWTLFMAINDLKYSQARNIESHIKRMKSKAYIKNLNQYVEMTEKLINQYK